MILLQNRFSGTFFAIFSSRKFARHTRAARQRLAALRAVTARQRFGLASRAATLGLVGVLAHPFMAQAANATHTYTSTTATTWTAAAWTGGVPSNNPGDLATAAITTSAQLTLNVAVTIGGITNTAGSAHTFQIVDDSNHFAFTLDDTGRTTNNALGDLNSFLYASSSGPLQVGTSIILSNTDADFATFNANNGGISIGAVGVNTINAAATQTRTLNLFSNDTASAHTFTINSDLGTSGGTLNIINKGTGTKLVTINGNLGVDVASLTQNSSTSGMGLFGANANYVGTTNIISGLIGAGANMNLGSVVDGGSGTSGELLTNAFTVTVTGLTTATGSTLANQSVQGTGGLIFTTGTTEFDGLITGTGLKLTINSGTLTLNGAGNSYSGLTTINGGTLNINSEYALGGSVYSGLTFGANGGTLIYNSTLLSGASYDITQNSATTPVAKAVTLTGNATINTNGNTVTYANAFGNSGTGSFTKAGAGTLTLSATPTYTGSTTVSGGTLVFGSATLPSSPTFTLAGGATLNVTAATAGLALNSGKTLTSTAASGATATLLGGAILNGGIINAGAAGSTLQATTLTSTSGSLNYNITDPTATTGTSSLINVTGTNGLTINGGAVSLTGGTFSFGTSYNITYNLFQFAGTLQGTGSSALTLTPASQTNGLTYTFGLAGNDVTLNISGTPLFSANWLTDGGGSWATAANWDNGVPNAQFATAIFGGAAPTHANLARTVTLDGNKTVGAITFASPNGESYTISDGTGGSLILDNGTGTALLSVGGTHTIDSTVPVTLSSNLTVNTTNSTDKLTIGGAITNTNTGTLAATLTKTGLGTLVLSNVNLYGPVAAGTVGTNLNGGTIQAGNNFAFSAGDVSFGGNAAVQAGAAGLTLPNNFAIGSGFTGTVDANGNTLTLSGIVSGTNGALTAASSTGTGTVVLTGAETYGAGTTINSAATLQVGNGSTTGSLPSTGAIVDNGTLAFDRSDATTIAVSNAISGSGGVVENGGTGNILQLNGTNGYTGTTTVTAGTLQLLSSGGIGTGDVSIASAGSLDLKGFSATVGGLNGAGTIDSSAAGTMTVTVGGNGDGGTFSGSIKNTNGTVSLTKNGAGTQTLSGVESYTGTTTVNTGALTLTNTLGSSGAYAGAIGLAAGATLNLNNATVFTSALFTNNTGNGPFISITGTSAVTVSGAVSLGNNGSNGNELSLTGGTLTAGSIGVTRAGENYGAGVLVSVVDGLYINGGTLIDTSTLNVVGSNSGGTTRIDSGSATIAGTTTINTTGNSRVSLLDVNGGTFTSNDTTGAGIQIGGTGTNYGELLVRNGTLNTKTITLGNSAATAGVDLFDAIGGTTYIGTGGIVAFGTGATQTVNFGSATVATAPIIAASGNWSSSLNITLTNSSTAVTPIIQTSDAGGTGHSITLSGVLSGAGGLNVTGAGNLLLTAVNSYTGATTIGTGATLQLGDGTTGHDGTIATSSGITDNGALVYNRFGALSSGLAISGTGSVTVSGSGSQTLTGASTYTGTTTVNGNLFVNGSIGSNTTPSGAVTVPTGGTLGGTGILTVASASVAGTLAPGATAGATTGALTLNTTSGLTISGTLTIALNAASGTSSGTVLNTGALTLSGATLSLTGTTDGTGTTIYDVVNYTGALSGTFANANVPSGYSLNYAGTTFGASDIELDPMTAVPEPGTWVGGGLLLLALGWNVNRRRSRAVAA